MPRLARLRLSGRKGWCHGAQRASAPHPRVHCCNRCPHPGPLDAQAAEMTRSARGRPQDSERPHPRPVRTPPSCVPADPRPVPRTRQSAREAREPNAGSFPTHLAPDPDRWNERMTRILRDAADVRDELARARSTEDTRLARRESAGCLALIGTRASSARPAGSRVVRDGEMPLPRSRHDDGPQ
jgi:hypothetical protein